MKKFKGYFMKIINLFLSLVVVFGLNLSAKDFSKMSKNPTLLQSGKEKMWCHICGMGLKMFYKTSHAVKLKMVKRGSIVLSDAWLKILQILKMILKRF